MQPLSEVPQPPPWAHLFLVAEARLRLRRRACSLAAARRLLLKAWPAQLPEQSIRIRTHPQAANTKFSAIQLMPAQYARRRHCQTWSHVLVLALRIPRARVLVMMLLLAVVINTALSRRELDHSHRSFNSHL